MVTYSYSEWIENYRAERAARCVHCGQGAPCGRSHTAGFCHDAANAMAKAFFPKLRVARGFVSGHPHWWCVAADGEIVDPTADQFSDLGIDLVYVEYDEGKHGPLPTGRCPDCGGYVYDGDTFCGPGCERAFADALNNERRS